jgi:hypothetical protein
VQGDVFLKYRGREGLSDRSGNSGYPFLGDTGVAFTRDELCRTAESGDVEYYPTLPATCQLVFLWRDKCVVWNLAFKKAYIISFFFIL